MQLQRNTPINNQVSNQELPSGISQALRNPTYLHQQTSTDNPLYRPKLHCPSALSDFGSSTKQPFLKITKTLKRGVQGLCTTASKSHKCSKK